MSASAASAASSASARARGRAILHDRRLLALLIAGGVMACVVVFVIGFSSAMFTATSKDAENTISTSSMKVALSKAGALIDGTNLKPGDTRTGTVTVTNVEHKAAMTLSATGLSDTPPGSSLGDVIQVTVRETSPGSAQRFSGRLRDLKDVALGTLASGEKRGFEVEIRWPSSAADSSLKGAKTSFSFEWVGTSVPS